MKKITILGLVLALILTPVYAGSEATSESSSPIINIDFQGIIDGIVNGLGDILNRLFLGLPGMLWDFFYESLLLRPLGLDNPDNNDDIISATGFFLTGQPDIEPFSPTIQKLSELLIVFLALGVIAASVRAMWEMLTSEEPGPIESTIKRDILPLFLGAFALSLSVEIYRIVLYIAKLLILLFMVNVDYLIFRSLALYLIAPDLFGLLGVALLFLFALFLLFTYILELVNAFLLPVFITLRALPFDMARATGQAGINFAVINAFMPVFSAMMVFIATSVWASPTFWESLALDGFALSLTRRILALVFLMLAILIPVTFYFTSLIVPVLRYAVAIKILKGVILNGKESDTGPGSAAPDDTVPARPAHWQLRGYHRRNYRQDF